MTDPGTGVQVTGAMIVVWLLQELKKSGKFPNINVDTVRLNRMISALGALLTGAAINYTWDPATHSLLITGLTSTAIASFFLTFLKQFVGQEMIYQFIYAPKAAARQAVAAQVVAQVVSTDQAAAKVVHAIEEKNGDS